MQQGKFNILLDAMWGSSGKGKLSAWLADKFNVTNISSSNFPNAGHTFQYGDFRFVAKVIPTAMALKQAKGLGVQGWLSPASGIPANADKDRYLKQADYTDMIGMAVKFASDVCMSYDNYISDEFAKGLQLHSKNQEAIPKP